MVNPLRFEWSADFLVGDPCLRRGDDQKRVNAAPSADRHPAG